MQTVNSAVVSLPVTHLNKRAIESINLETNFFIEEFSREYHRSTDLKLKISFANFL